MPFLLLNDHLIACKNRRDRGLHIHSNAKAAEAMKLSYCLGASSDNRTGRKRWRKTGIRHYRAASGLIWFHPGGEKVDGHRQLSSGEDDPIREIIAFGAAAKCCSHTTTRRLTPLW
jgi:hypothetical protein